MYRTDSQKRCLMIENSRKSAPSNSDKDNDETPRQMELGVFQSKNSSIVYDADSQKIITQAEASKRAAAESSVSSKHVSTGQRTKTFSFAKTRSTTSKSLTKHKSTAAAFKKQHDISMDTTSKGDQTDDLIHSVYSQSTLKDCVRTQVPQPE